MKYSYGQDISCLRIGIGMCFEQLSYDLCPMPVSGKECAISSELTSLVCEE